MAAQLRPKVYNLDMLRDEARALIDKHMVDRQQPIHALCRFIPEEGWQCMELALAENEFLLRDRIIDLIGDEVWKED